jgi:hypothetical protein
MSHCYLRIGSDTVEEATTCDSLSAAKRKFRNVAEDLARFEQTIDATIHIANNRDELVEDADYYLSLGPRGGLRCERC